MFTWTVDGVTACACVSLYQPVCVFGKCVCVKEQYFHMSVAHPHISKCPMPLFHGGRIGARGGATSSQLWCRSGASTHLYTCPPFLHQCFNAALKRSFNSLLPPLSASSSPCSSHVMCFLLIAAQGEHMLLRADAKQSVVNCVQRSPLLQPTHRSDFCTSS